ncbi:type II secretion system protein GspD [Planctomycetota bacterium]
MYYKKYLKNVFYICVGSRYGENTLKVKNLVIRALVFFVVAAIAVGDVKSDAINTPAAGISAQSRDNQNTVAVSDNERLPFIGFQEDETIRGGLRILATYYRKNIIPSSKIDGKLTVTALYDVTFDEAMDAILGYEYTYEEKGNFIKVYTADEYTKIKEHKSRLTHKIFTLYYITAAEAKKLVMPVLSTAGIAEVTAAAETGVPVSESISSSDGGDTTAMSDTMIVFDFPENIEKAADVIKSIDIMPKQILIEATIMTVTLTEGMDFGLDWQTLRGTAPNSLTDIAKNSPDYFKSAGGSSISTLALNGGGTIGFAIDNIGAFIRAVEEVTDVTVLANPKILAVNKQLGQVYIGTKVPYQSQITQTDTTTTSEVSFLDTGTKLSFRPYICDNGYIRMDIHPKDSSSTSITINTGQSAPQETSAELATNIMVKDGQTIVIGGMFRDEISTSKSQVPILGDIPIIGQLFKSNGDATIRQEVIVMLTPHIIKEPSEALGQARMADVNRKKYGAKAGLHWANSQMRAEDNYKKAAKHYLAGNKKAALHELNWALHIYPSYIEAIRLKERIINETNGDDVTAIERIMMGVVEKPDTKMWQRQ